MKLYLSYLPWLAAAGILVIVFGTMYVTLQQAERWGANFPQVQVAEDIAAAINQGAKPASFTSGHVDMAASLAPFVIIYDKSGKAVGGSGYLAGQVPTAPLGMLQASKGEMYHAITWEPEDKVRIASVTVATDKYYVLSGRSLLEVEKSEDATFWRIFAAGIVALVVLGGMFFFSQTVLAKRAK